MPCLCCPAANVIKPLDDPPTLTRVENRALFTFLGCESNLQLKLAEWYSSTTDERNDAERKKLIAQARSCLKQREALGLFDRHSSFIQFVYSWLQANGTLAEDVRKKLLACQEKVQFPLSWGPFKGDNDV